MGMTICVFADGMGLVCPRVDVIAVCFNSIASSRLISPRSARSMSSGGAPLRNFYACWTSGTITPCFRATSAINFLGNSTSRAASIAAIALVLICVGGTSP